MDTFSIDVNKIAAETISELSKNAAAIVAGKLKKAAKDAILKGSIDFGSAFRKYLTASKERCEKIKTLLYKQDPQSLYAFYVSLNVRRGRKVIETKDINNILDIGHKLIVSGTGGIGKTIMLKYFFVDCVKRTDLIPVLVELRGLNDRETKDISLSGYIYENLKMYNFDLEEEYFKYSLETGCYLLLFDGFDEVKSDLADKVSREITALSIKYSDNYFIVSSRPSEEFVGWNDFVELDAMPMTKVQALELIQKLEYDDTIKQKFYRALDSDLFLRYKSFASNPLLLTIMLITFDSQAAIPEKLNDFYEQAFSAMFSRHDALKGGFRRDIASKLSYEEFKSVFSYFCFKSYFKSQFEFTQSQVISLIQEAREKIAPGSAFTGQDYLHDLTNSVCMLLHEGINYKFSHRSFQEYFAALYTTQLDDKTQKKLLTAWIKENRSMALSYSSGYLSMLYDLQRERFVKNVLRPGLLKLEKDFLAAGQNPGWLLETIYSGIMLRGAFLQSTRGNPKELNRLYLVVSYPNGYYASLLSISYSLLGLSFKQLEKPYLELQRNVSSRLKKELGPRAEHLISFETLKQASTGLYEEVVQACGAPVKQLEAALKLVHQYGDSAIRNKSRIDSLLNEL